MAGELRTPRFHRKGCPPTGGATRYGINPANEPLSNPFTQQQIADITGQTSVNVNRVFADLERQGLIKRQGRDIFFKDWNEMLRVASFQPNYLD